MTTLTEYERVNSGDPQATMWTFTPQNNLVQLREGDDNGGQIRSNESSEAQVHNNGGQAPMNKSSKDQVDDCQNETAKICADGSISEANRADAQATSNEQQTQVKSNQYYDKHVDCDSNSVDYNHSIEYIPFT